MILQIFLQFVQNFAFCMLEKLLVVKFGCVFAFPLHAVLCSSYSTFRESQMHDIDVNFMSSNSNYKSTRLVQVRRIGWAAIIYVEFGSDED